MSKTSAALALVKAIIPILILSINSQQAFADDSIPLKQYVCTTTADTRHSIEPMDFECVDFSKTDAQTGPCLSAPEDGFATSHEIFMFNRDKNSTNKVYQATSSSGYIYKFSFDSQDNAHFTKTDISGYGGILDSADCVPRKAYR